MTHTPTLARLLGALDEALAQPKVVPAKVSDLRSLLNPAEGGEDGVTLLPFGATPKRPEGYVSEAEYLAAVRRTAPMSVTSSERRSHLRWMPEADGIVGLILEAKDRGWQGNAACEIQRMKARRARWTSPNVILGS